MSKAAEAKKAARPKHSSDRNAGLLLVRVTLADRLRVAALLAR